ncbi:MFS multidrug transporter-like protein [Lindgomyces ingoldianus]|uniref:MFS multidrug transporter-like protein n=1 Tax=Lindgomyces ingoldianus TaxID=673940 RepID=A0ACB6QB80_9PLEO|nr:MFS multidrug transporter-like protein [Lindgomyces ingoldianus]KAF2464224.1 MFS multidrug transporter-like protein [Lindgomyces ingoldianus]
MKQNPAPIKKAEGAVQSEGQLQSWRLNVVMGALVFAVLAMALSASIVATAIPVLTSHFHSTADIGWYGSAYLMASCALIPLAGKIYTLYDLKVGFLAYMTAFTVGSVICGAATSSNMLIAGRAIAGAGSSGIITGAMAIINASVTLDKRSCKLQCAVLVGIIQSLSGVGVVLGPIVGGALTQHASWRWCFFVGVPVCGLAMLVVIVVPFPRRRKDGPSLEIMQKIRDLDLIGCAIFAPSVVLLLVALQWGGNKYRWGSSKVIGLFCGSGATFIAFLIWEYYFGEKAMVPLHMLKRQVMACGFTTNNFQMGGLMLITYYLPIWFQSVKDASPTMSGVMTLPQSLSQIIFSIMSGWLVSRLGYYTPWAIVGSAFTALGTGLMLTFTPSTDAGKWIGYQILVGCGRGFVIQNVFTAAQADLPKELEDIGSAFLVFAMFLGGAIFVALGETILSNALPTELAKYAPGIPKSSIEQGLAASTLTKLPPSVAKSVKLAINNALIKTFYLALGGSVVGFLASWGLKWYNVKKRSPPIDMEGRHEKSSGQVRNVRSE